MAPLLNSLVANKQRCTHRELIISIFISGTMELLKEDYLKKHHPDVVTFMKVSKIRPLFQASVFRPLALGPMFSTLGFRPLVLGLCFKAHGFEFVF